MKTPKSNLTTTVEALFYNQIKIIPIGDAFIDLARNALAGNVLGEYDLAGELSDLAKKIQITSIKEYLSGYKEGIDFVAVPKMQKVDHLFNIQKAFLDHTPAGPESLENPETLLELSKKVSKSLKEYKDETLAQYRRLHAAVSKRKGLKIEILEELLRLAYRSDMTIVLPKQVEQEQKYSIRLGYYDLHFIETNKPCKVREKEVKQGNIVFEMIEKQDRIISSIIWPTSKKEMAFHSAFIYSKKEAEWSLRKEIEQIVNEMAEKKASDMFSRNIEVLSEEYKQGNGQTELAKNGKITVIASSSSFKSEKKSPIQVYRSIPKDINQQNIYAVVLHTEDILAKLTEKVDPHEKEFKKLNKLNAIKIHSDIYEKENLPSIFTQLQKEYGFTYMPAEHFIKGTETKEKARKELNIGLITKQDRYLRNWTAISYHLGNEGVLKHPVKEIYVTATRIVQDTYRVRTDLEKIIEKTNLESAGIQLDPMTERFLWKATVLNRFHTVMKEYENEDWMIPTAPDYYIFEEILKKVPTLKGAEDIYNQAVKYLRTIIETVITKDAKEDNWFNGHILGDYALAAKGPTAVDIARSLMLGSHILKNITFRLPKQIGTSMRIVKHVRETKTPYNPNKSIFTTDLNEIKSQVYAAIITEAARLAMFAVKRGLGKDIVESYVNIVHEGKKLFTSVT